MSYIEIRFDWNPPAELSPNSRVHWRTKARAVKVARQIGKFTTINALPSGFEIRHDERVHIDLQVYWGYRRQRQDVDNVIAMHKALIDGVFDALGADDSCVEDITCEQWRDPARVGFVIVSMETRASAGVT